MRVNAQGAVLAISLMLLLIITLLAVSIIQVTQMEEKMSANYQDKLLSFTATQSALEAGENVIIHLNAPLPECAGPTNTATCAYTETYLSGFDLKTQDDNWWDAYAAMYNTTLSSIRTQPRYLIEKLSEDTNKDTGITNYYYQVTARGKGGTDAAISILQSVVMWTATPSSDNTIGRKSWIQLQ